MDSFLVWALSVIAVAAGLMLTWALSVADPIGRFVRGQPWPEAESDGSIEK
jgi:hypothetical protein